MTDATKKLSTKEVLSYAMGDVANNLSFMMTSMFLMVYMTDLVGISAGVAGTIYAVTKIWAGVSDLIAGQTVDRVDTRWGHLRPFVLFGSLPLAAVFVLLFSTPAGLGPAAAIAWVFVLDALFQLCYSFVNIPYGSLSAAMTQDSVDRSRLSGARSIAGSLTSLLLAAVVSPQFDTITEESRSTFTITVLILGVIAIALYFLCFRNTRERIKGSGARTTMKSTLRMLGQNRPLQMLCLGALFVLGANFTLNAVAMYYARDVLGNAGWYFFLTLGQSIGTIAAASLIATLTKHYGKKKSYMLMAVVSVVGYAILMVAPGGTWVGGFLGYMVMGFGLGGTNALMFAMQADTVDYGEWKSGTRAEGGSYSILSFTRKVGQGIGGGLGAAIIGAFGYAGGAAAQTDQAVLGIRIASGGAPALLAAVAVVIVIFYPLTEEKYRDVVADLATRHAKATPTTALQPAVEGDAADASPFDQTDPDTRR